MEFLSPAATSGLILAITLVMFVSEKVRHDLVAVLALLASLVLGLVPPKEALLGFGDPAVIAVAAVLIVGRALELSGVAGVVTQKLMPAKAPFVLRMALLLCAAAFLSAFMNNIAALVITMPMAIEIARTARRSPAVILMPLAFTTILGGMTTLIGTPANLIISSVRERQLGEPFSFFAMAPVGTLVTVLGIAYVVLLGWRLLPIRRAPTVASKQPWMVLDLRVESDTHMSKNELAAALRETTTRLRGVVRDGATVSWPVDGLQPGDRLLLLTRTDPRRVADTIPFASPDWLHDPNVPMARVSVAYGSALIGRGYGELPFLTSGALHVVAGGPRAAKVRAPLSLLPIQAGDQLFIEGRAEDLARYAQQMRLLEIDRFDRQTISSKRAYAIVAIFVSAILAVVLAGTPPALSFLAAAAAIAALGLISGKEAYGAIDWSIIVLLAAMIPVGTSFESSGAAAIVADWLGEILGNQPLVVAIGAMCFVTMILSIFLNNVATALVMAPLGIRLADLLNVPPDAMLLAVLIGASSDFLTPIGHQNNLLVMGPGGYRFGDYIRMGAIQTAIVVCATAMFLAWRFG